MQSLRSTALGLGENRGSPRVYMQGRWLAAAGFEPGSRYGVSYSAGRVVLDLAESGPLRVSSKGQQRTPVVDLSNEELGRTLATGQVQVTTYPRRIEITAAHSVILVTTRRFAYTEGSLFSGGGLLTEAAKGLGFNPRFAVELSPQYADVYERNHPSAVMFNCSVEEVAWDRLQAFGPLGLLTMGVPCEPFSVIRRLDKGGQEKRDKSLPPEAHDLGDMVFWALRAVEATNPYAVVVENVPGFLNAGSGFILQNTLRRLGYHVDARVIDPLEYGELTGRKRAVVVASAAPVRWPETTVSRRTLGEILEAEPHAWWDRQSKPWPFNHWDAQTAKGNGFAAQQVSAASTKVGTIKKRYFAGQGDNPVVAHPTLPDTFRWFTLPEVMRLHGLSEDYYLGDSKTLAGEVIGQGVVVSTMRRIIASNVPPTEEG